MTNPTKKCCAYEHEHTHPCLAPLSPMEKCCVPETDFAELEKSIDLILEKHPSAPTPGEVADEDVEAAIKCLQAPRPEIAIAKLLFSHASKAREEGRKEGYEVGYTKAQIDLRADDEIIGAEPCGGGCNGYKRAGASHCAFIGCGSRPDSQTNPKKL